MDFYNNNYATPAAFGSTFVGYYVTNYQDVLNSPAPITGEPVLFANLDHGVLYSKKLVNGRAFVQAYSIAPVNSTGYPPKAPETHTEPSSDDLSKRMDKLTSEIENLAKSLSTKKQEDKVDGSK